MKKLFLLDAYALIFRGYYAFIKNPRISSKGLNTSAIIGFMNSVLDVIKREKPDYIAVAFDKGGSIERSEIFTDYKANREETPEAIKIAVPYIQQILKAMNITILEKAGYEADDIIGTVAKQAEKQGFTTYMVTPDKDFGQLVSDHIFVYKPARSGKEIEIWGVKEVQEKFGVQHPEQVVDFLGMMGDAVDNIPGLPGVGEKTAKKLIEEFGSMENLLVNTHLLKGKLREGIEQNKDKGLISKILAKIILDVPIDFSFEELKLQTPDMQALIPIFEELEFRTLTQQVKNFFFPNLEEKSEENVNKSKKTSTENQSLKSAQLSLFDEEEVSTFTKLSDIEHHYVLIKEKDEVKKLLIQLLQQKEVCFDTETTSLDELNAEIVGISFSFKKNTGFYISLPENKQECKGFLSILKPFFENTNILKIGQNLKYDLKILRNYNIQVKGELFDTMLAHYLINPDLRHNMDILAENYLNYKPISIEALIGKKGKSQASMRDVDLELQKEYAVEDTDVTLQLKQIFQQKLEENHLLKLFKEVEMPLLQVLMQMELSGISLDIEFLKLLSTEIQNEITILESEIYAQAGEEFNLSSPKQLGDILFEKLKLVSKPKKTKTGQYATSEEILSELAPKHQIVSNILYFRQLQKLKSTYVDALPLQLNEKTKKIHTTYMQAVAATGRLSSNNPNLQNIPIRSQMGQKVRQAFVSDSEDFILLSADYSQIELRIIASLSQEKSMIEAFLNGEDIHRSTASKVFKVKPEEVTKEQRSHAKTINFGIIYGVSAVGLSQQTDLSRQESKALIDAYFKSYPMLKNYISTQIEFARNNGFVETILGRRRYLPDINSLNSIVKGAAERNAVNAPIQGSAADIIKIAMIRIQQKFSENNFKSKMLLQVHDELVFDIYLPEYEQVVEIIKTEMQNAYSFDVPLLVEIGKGKNWLEAH